MDYKQLSKYAAFGATCVGLTLIAQSDFSDMTDLVRGGDVSVKGAQYEVTSIRFEKEKLYDFGGKKSNRAVCALESTKKLKIVKGVDLENKLIFDKKDCPVNYCKPEPKCERQHAQKSSSKKSSGKNARKKSASKDKAYDVKDRNLCARDGSGEYRGVDAIVVSSSGGIKPLLGKKCELHKKEMRVPRPMVRAYAPPSDIGTLLTPTDVSDTNN